MITLKHKPTDETIYAGNYQAVIDAMGDIDTDLQDKAQKALDKAMQTFFKKVTDVDVVVN